MKKLFVVFTIWFFLPLNIAWAQCGPVFDGAILNSAFECINDTVMMQVDSSKADAAGWQYADGSLLDGVEGGRVGGTRYEIFGIAFRETDSEVWLVLNSNVPLDGIARRGARNGSIAWGDLFFNFGADTFQATSAAEELFAIRYADMNDSNAADIGVYETVSAFSVTSQKRWEFPRAIFGRSSATERECRLATLCDPSVWCKPPTFLRKTNWISDRSPRRPALAPSPVLPGPSAGCTK